MSHDVQLSPATSNAPIVTLPSLAPAGHVTEAPACHSRGPGPVRRRPGARPAAGTDHKRQARRGTCQASPATLLTAIDLRGTSDTPGTDVTQTCAVTGHRSAPQPRREYEDFYNTHRPDRTLNQATPLRPLPEGVTDLDHFRLRRRDRTGGVIHEYRLVA